MTCFWNAILSSLTEDDKIKLNIKKRLFPNIMVDVFKNNNIKTPDVLWNNKKLSEQQQNENIAHIKELDITKIDSGYLCSGCDPFLILLCQLLKVTIHHIYNGHIIIYENIKSERRIINYGSDYGHFWYY